MCVCVCSYLQDETLWAGKLVIPHGFVHEQEEQAGQKGQSDEDQTCDLSKTHTHTHKNTYMVALQRQASSAPIPTPLKDQSQELVLVCLSVLYNFPTQPQVPTAGNFNV